MKSKRKLWNSSEKQWMTMKQGKAMEKQCKTMEKQTKAMKSRRKLWRSSEKQWKSKRKPWKSNEKQGKASKSNGKTRKSKDKQAQARLKQGKANQPNPKIYRNLKNQIPLLLLFLICVLVVFVAPNCVCCVPRLRINLISSILDWNQKGHVCIFDQSTRCPFFYLNIYSSLSSIHANPKRRKKKQFSKNSLNDNLTFKGFRFIWQISLDTNLPVIAAPSQVFHRSFAGPHGQVGFSTVGKLSQE